MRKQKFKSGKMPLFSDNLQDQTAIKHAYWTPRKVNELYKKWRPGSSVSQTLFSMADSPEKIAKVYKLRGFQFGNWITPEDKYNYLAIAYICFNDINRVLKFKNNIGLSGRLGVSFGARGASAAAAHFEAQTEIINISRYWRNDRLKKYYEAFGQRVPDGYIFKKEDRLLETGGAGSFAHEYGHFLDYSFGRYIEPDAKSNWLTGIYRTTARKITVDPGKKLRNLTKNVMDAALLDKNGNPSAYSKKLSGVKSDYINRRLEIFARIFEQYIQHKLKDMKINNRFLTQLVYKSNFYLTPTELKKVVPHMDKLISEMRKYV